MPSTSFSPAFGQADLSNCEREQIHLAGSIQPHGALLVVRDEDHVVVQASANAVAFLRWPSEVLGERLATICPELYRQITPRLGESLHLIPLALRGTAGRRVDLLDVSVHKPVGGGLIVELEQTGPSVNLGRDVESAVRGLIAAASLRELCDETAATLKALTGYDRVMVYRFDDEGHGEVFAEAREHTLEPFLGNRYPASDIPQIARRLYERNRVRVLVDVQYDPVPIKPRLSPITAQDLDMSLCILRSSSPIHVQYLKNMGVRATLVISLMVGGRLWGLIACHHYAPRQVHYEARAVCELLAEAVGTRIAALESFTHAQAGLSVRRLEQRIVETVTNGGDWGAALFDQPQLLLAPLEASGAAMLIEDQILSAGEVPGTTELRALGRWLDRQTESPLIATASLRGRAPEFARISGVASGLVAARIANVGTEYLIWFRPERVRTVTWGGNPHKAVEPGNDPSQLSPRRSFAKWHEVVEGTAEPWTTANLSAARLIGECVTDLILQFRSVRMLIAQDQLAQARRRVSASSQPVVIADASGQVLLSNESFEEMLRAGHPHLQQIEDLAALFHKPAELRQRMNDLVVQRRPWRGEFTLDGREPRPVLIRADPVFAPPQRLLGYVLIFTDLTERQAASVARRRFQEQVVDTRRPSTLTVGNEADLAFRNLMASIVGNAQLAALEITDGVDLANMPLLLESVEQSVNRATRILQHLVMHARGTSNDSPR